MLSMRALRVVKRVSISERVVVGASVKKVVSGATYAWVIFKFNLIYE
jgi:hypothetical protein